MAAALFCSRSSVYRTIWAHREQTLGPEHDAVGRLAPPVRTTVLCPTLGRTLVGLLKAPPGLWLVPNALELCHACLDTANHAWDRGLG
jgi:hypothetical protein